MIFIEGISDLRPTLRPLVLKHRRNTEEYLPKTTQYPENCNSININLIKSYPRYIVLTVVLILSLAASVASILEGGAGAVQWRRG